MAPSSVDNVNDIGDIQIEIDTMQNLVGALQLEVDQKQNRFRSELQQLGTRFKDAICIPPMGNKTSIIC